MEATISVGTWVIPTLFTIIAFTVAYFKTTDSGGSYGIDLSPIFYGGGAIILSLVSWLMWSLMS